MSLKDIITDPCIRAELLNETRRRKSIVIDPIYLAMCGGDLVAAVLLADVVYWHKPNAQGQSKLRVKRDGFLWIAKSDKDWAHELGLTKDQVRRGRNKLKEMALVVCEKYKFNAAPTMHLRLDFNVFSALFKSHKAEWESGFVIENGPEPKWIWDSAQMDLGSSPNGNGPQPKSITEITTQTTTKTTTNQQATDQTADPEQADLVLAELQNFDDQNIHPVIAKVLQVCGITGPDAVAKHQMWAEGLIRQYGFEAVEQQAEWLPYRKNVKIPKQMLAAALKDNYEAPQLPPDVELAMQKREMIAQIWANIEGIDDLPVLENGSEYSMCNQRLNAIMRPAFDRAIEAGRVNEGEVFWHRRREAEGVLMGEYFSYNGDMQPVCAYELVFMDWPGRQQDLGAVINAI